MKIITWNCNGGFRNKYKSIVEFDADIYIIQECENPALVKNDEIFRKFSENALWIGDNKNKGLGVFSKKDHNIEKLSWNETYRGHQLKWFIPFKINNGLTFLAVWNHHAKAKAFKYIGQFWLYMQNNKELLHNCIIAGDFNSNSIWDSWDRWWNHSDCVKDLEVINTHSIYHKRLYIKQGSEQDKTFFLHHNSQKGYHIDYIFSPEKYLDQTKDFEIGKYDKWSSKSDHLPLVWEFYIS